jgi:hypothetical protein
MSGGISQGEGTMRVGILLAAILALSACGPSFQRMQDPKTAAFVDCQGADMNNCVDSHEKMGWIKLMPGQNQSNVPAGK